jgi:hypothetical protein
MEVMDIAISSLKDVLKDVDSSNPRARTKFERHDRNGLSFPGLEITDKIDSSVLGVTNRREFSFSLYAEVLDHFNIKARDWVNPGRVYDAWLIEMRKNQIVENFANAFDVLGHEAKRRYRVVVNEMIEEFGPEIMEQFE